MKRHLLAAFLLLAASSFLRADGGITIGQIEQDGLRVTVFAAPVPIRAGLLDVSALVQEIPSNQPVVGASIAFSAQLLSPPSPKPARLPSWCTTIVPGASIPATSAHSKNKLLSGAYIPLTESGRWVLRIRVTHDLKDFTVNIPLDVAPPQQPLSTWWPVIALAPAGILLYIWRSRLIRAGRGGKSGTGTSNV